MILSKRCCLALLVLLPIGLFADVMVISRAMKATTIAEVFIENDKVRVEVEIGVGDIPAFRNILRTPSTKRWATSRIRLPSVWNFSSAKIL